MHQELIDYVARENGLVSGQEDTNSRYSFIKFDSIPT